MAPSIPTCVPSQIRAGDTVRFTRNYSDYPVGDGWTLKFSLAGPGKIGVDGTTSGADALFTLPAAKTADLAPGTYRFAIVASLDGARYTAEEGVCTVLADVTTASAGALRSHDEQVLELLEAELLARAGSDHTEYSVDGRSLKREDITVLTAWADKLRSRIARRRNGGRLGMVAVQFTKTGAAQ